VLSGEATNTILIVFGLTRPGFEPTIYRTRGEHVSHYATDAVFYHWIEVPPWINNPHGFTYVEGKNQEGIMKRKFKQLHMVNNCTNINKMNYHLSPKLTEHTKRLRYITYRKSRSCVSIEEKLV
jgi:hypothetical protein